MLQYFCIFNLFFFFPLGVHLYLSGWHLISSYYIVLPLSKSKVSAYVILTLSLIISLDFGLYFLPELQSMDFKCVFLLSWFKFIHLLPSAFIVVTLLSAEFISK